MIHNKRKAFHSPAGWFRLWQYWHISWWYPLIPEEKFSSWRWWSQTYPYCIVWILHVCAQSKQCQPLFFKWIYISLTRTKKKFAFENTRATFIQLPTGIIWSDREAADFRRGLYQLLKPFRFVSAVLGSPIVFWRISDDSHTLLRFFFSSNYHYL